MEIIEELEPLEVPSEARWTPEPIDPGTIDPHDPEAVRRAAARLAVVDVERSDGEAQPDTTRAT